MILEFQKLHYTIIWMKFHEQENSAVIEYTARNDLKKVFSSTQNLELVNYF
jgi:hypothetical protein